MTACAAVLPLLFLGILVLFITTMVPRTGRPLLGEVFGKLFDTNHEDRALDQLREHRAVRPASLAMRLVAAAARFLPVTDRARYLEEFLGELSELSSSGAGRTQQVRYAVSQLLRIPVMRGIMRADRRTRVTP
jgi:hypothetical protein